MKYAKNYDDDDVFNELYREDVISITSDLFNKSAVLWENSINTVTDSVGALTTKHEGVKLQSWLQTCSALRD